MMRVRTHKIPWLRVLVHVGALLPLAQLVWKYVQGAFLVDPVLEITTRTGRLALLLLVLSLACTPLYTLLGWAGFLRVRRALGLYAFLYAGLHGLTFVGLDYRFDLGLLGPAILDAQYVLVGMAAFLVLLPLAITSTRRWQKRLGKAWRRLHRLAYLAGLLAIVHFAWLVKDLRDPLRYGGVLAALFVLRLPPVRRAIRGLRQRVGALWTRVGAKERAAEDSATTDEVQRTRG
jgi:sulfoxide reductase heme-binding subunit YedZ